MFAVLTIISVELWRRLGAWMTLIPSAAMVLPVVITTGIRKLPPALIEDLHLGNPATVYALSGRTVIWRTTLEGFAGRPLADLFGYGCAGHLISGLSNQYAYVLARPAIKGYQGPHNLHLQLVLDVGLIGAGLFLIVAVLAIRGLVERARLNASPSVLALLGLFVYMFLLGALERVPTVYSQELFISFMLSVLWMLAPPGSDRTMSKDASGEAGLGRSPDTRVGT